MKKPNVSKIISNVKTGLSTHSTEILTGIGIAGMISATVLAVKATPKALDLIAKAENEKFDNGEGAKLTKMELVKVAWKPYIPTLITCTLSTVCLIGANSVNNKRNAALATAYKISENALTEYKAKVVETIGEKKEQAIRESISNDHIENNPVGKNEVLITEKGNTLCYDHHSGRYFKSDYDAIKRAENNINYRLLSEEYISLNELYEELGLGSTKMGDSVGWNIGRDGQLKILLSSHLAEDGTPCLALDYNVAPRYDYSKLSY